MAKAPQRFEIEIGFHEPSGEPGGGARGYARVIGRDLDDAQWEMTKKAIEHLVQVEGERRGAPAGVITEWCVVLLGVDVCQDDADAHCPMEAYGPFSHDEAGVILGTVPPGLLPHRVPLKRAAP